MSQGNPIVKCRVSRHQLAQIVDFVERYNQKQTCREPIDISWFIRTAIREKIQKATRGGRKFKIAQLVRSAAELQMEKEIVNGIVAETSEAT